MVYRKYECKLIVFTPLVPKSLFVAQSCFILAVFLLMSDNTRSAVNQLKLVDIPRNNPRM